MIRSVADLQDYAVHATDGDIGQVDEFYFDDDKWTIRYLVVQTGSWLSDRRVLVSPISFHEADWEHQRIVLTLTQDQVRNAPDIDTAKPISRQREIEFNKYYGWQYYWLGAEIWGAGMNPGALIAPAVLPPSQPTRPPAPESAEEDTRDTHLRSTKEVLGYHILARDGEVGHVADFLFDDATWRIDYLVIDTSNWLFGKKVVLAPTWVKTVTWAQRQVAVDLRRETIKNSPEFDSAAFLHHA